MLKVPMNLKVTVISMFKKGKIDDCNNYDGHNNVYEKIMYIQILTKIMNY